MSRRKPYEIGEAPAGVPTVWTSLEDKHRDPEEKKRIAEAEFSHPIVDANSLLSRRNFLQFSGATVAALGASGCIRRPVENILPYSQAPEDIVPGVAQHFATVREQRGDAFGLVVESHEGRPTKVEGNPDHPGSRGKSDLYSQASILDLYDPDRSRGPARRKGNELVDATFPEFDRALRDRLVEHAKNGGQGLRILVQPSTSPSEHRMRKAIARAYPNARIHWHSSVHDQNVFAGTRIAFGRPLQPAYALETARVILSLDSDFLLTETGSLRHTRGFAANRRPMSPRQDMNRLYVVESALSTAGAAADHRLRLPSREIGRYLDALAIELATRHGVDLGPIAQTLGKGAAEGIPETWIREVAADLAAHRGGAPILVGARQPARVHALAHALNVGLGNLGRSVFFFPSEEGEALEEAPGIEILAEDIRQGRVSTLIVLGGNPVYSAPAELEFAKLLGADGLTSFHLSSHRNETSRLTSWHAPEAHYLEAWGDRRGIDGVIAIQQPLIAPLFHGRSVLEMLAILAGERAWRGHEVVRATLAGSAPITAAFESEWRRTLHRGTVDGSAYAPLNDLALDASSIANTLQARREGAALGKDNLEVVFTVDPTTWAGEFANNAWLLETPDMLTQLVWDNAALMSANTAKAIGVRNGEVVRLAREGAGEIEIAVVILPGLPEWSIALPLGWGRTAAGRYGNGQGFDVSRLRTSGGFWFTDGVRATPTGRKHKLVQIQEHYSMEGRPIAIDATLDKIETNDPNYAHKPAYREEPEFAAFRSVLPTTPPLWEEVDYSDVHKWGMTIDLSTCTGCSACVVACQSENNIPVVGKSQAGVGRHMHWIRIDRYFMGENEDDPLVAMQPRACVHCEEAPCENVCPVYATTHSPEGLNEMTYNRCIGTRYCMNNCPYKVRRFNYLNWHDRDPEGEVPETKKMVFNPNVTVRSRGVMEKCTYCVQRIQAARHTAKREDRRIRDGEITPACAQACPASAITFGDLNDPQSAATKMATLDRSYKLLAQLGTQPRTTFLGKIRNPNPAMLRSGTEAHQ